MVEGVEIKGGASEFEAAVIAVVMDKIAQDDKRVSQRRQSVPGGRFLPAWVRALHDYGPGLPRETVRPD